MTKYTSIYKCPLCLIPMDTDLDKHLQYSDAECKNCNFRIYDNVFIFAIDNDDDIYWIHWMWDGDIIIFDPHRTLISIERPDLTTIKHPIKDFLIKTMNNSVLM